MSATLEVETFEKFFQGCDKINIPGRQYPVQIVYTKEAQEVSVTLSKTCAELLVFLLWDGGVLTW